ncbi:MAG: hypothetical protein IK114_14155 [Fibrobacter sp.]|nr:hypothetical protein [Fibrobacter sp.]
MNKSDLRRVSRAQRHIKKALIELGRVQFDGVKKPEYDKVMAVILTTTDLYCNIEDLTTKQHD